MREVRVLEVAGSLAGAYCGRLFATAGSDVVVLEPPGGGPLRGAPPHLDGGGRSALHEYLDAHKRSVALELDDPQVDQALRWADLVISSCDGDVAASDALHRRVVAANPAAVHLVLSGFGLSGPYAGWRHSPLVDWACGGYLYITGEPSREPLQGGGPWATYLAGVTGAVGAQAALIEAARTGQGQLVDVGAMESLAAGHQWSLTMYTHTGVVKRRWGTRFGESYHPMSLYRCRDGWICIGAPSREQWERLCIAVEAVELLADDDLYAPAVRFERAEEIDRAFEPWLAARTAEEAVEALQAERVPASRLLTFTEVLRSEQLSSRSFWVERPDLGEGARQPRAAFAAAGAGPFRPAPALGADTEAFLAEVAGGGARPARPRLDLSQVRVLEFSVAWAGPLAGRFLADLGAEVVKVEHPTSRGFGTTGGKGGPPASSWRWGTLPDPRVRAEVFPGADPGERWWNRMGVWNKMNRGKQSLCLEAKDDEGAEVLAAMIARSDLVLHNFSPRGATSLGIDAAGVAKHNDRAVTVAMTGYGETGPMATHSSYGPILEAYAGFDEATGYRGEGPMRLGLAFPDAVGGLHGTFAILAALWERELSGEAVHVDLSQLETLLSLAGESLLVASVTGRAPERRGNRSLQHAPQGVYRCAGEDGWVALTVTDDEAWRRLVDLVGDEELQALAGADVAERFARHDRIDALLARWTAERPALEAARLLQGAGVAACPPFTNQELVEDPHLASRGFMATWDQPDVGVQRFPGFPIHFERTRVELRPAPPLGGHNTSLLQQLGYDDDAIRRLHERGVVADRPPA